MCSKEPEWKSNIFYRLLIWIDIKKNPVGDTLINKNILEVRKSKLFILAGVGGHDRQVYVQVESHTQV